MSQHHANKPGHQLSRRSFMQASAAVGGGTLLVKNAAAASTNLEGYASATSVDAGATLRFHARDPQAVGTGTTVYPLTVVRLGWPDQVMLSTRVTIGDRVVPADASANGCRWPASYQLSVPKSWPSGLYFAAIGAGPNACTVPFVVTVKAASKGAKALVLIPVNTVQAYNAYGGKSLYDFNSSSALRGAKVSFDRPFTEPFNSFFDVWSQYLVRWLAKNRITADFCTDTDLHADSQVLEPYQLLVQAGHDEYWTLAMRKRVDSFVAGGGNVAFLGGNTCWFQARLESGNGVANRSLVCYKNAAADPETNAALKTTTWHELSPVNPENKSTGLSFIKGCSWSNAGIPRPATPYTVQRPEHWVYAGTGLAQGAAFGAGYVGYEADAADFRLGADNRPYATGLDGSPATLRILAQADASNWDALSLAAGGTGELSGYCHLAIFSRVGEAGTVFNAGSTDWAFGLRPELDGQTPSPISRITLNVINQLSKMWSESVDVRQYRAAAANGDVSLYLGTAATGPAGALLDGLAFRAFAAPESGTLPVYRYRSRSAGAYGLRYRLSLYGQLDGAWQRETAPAFYAYPQPRSGAVAVFEAATTDATGQALYRYSTTAVVASGCSGNGTVFYVPVV